MVLCSQGDPSPGPGQFPPHQLFKCSAPPPARRPDSSVTEEVKSKPRGSSLASRAPNLGSHLAPPPCRLSQAGVGSFLLSTSPGWSGSQPPRCPGDFIPLITLSLSPIFNFSLSWLHSGLNLKIKNKAQSLCSASFSSYCLSLLCAIRLL